MHILYIIIIGFVAGVIAKFFIPGPNDPGGFVMTTILGIAGSFLANFLAVKLGWAQNGGEGVNLLSAVVGAFILLLIYHLVTSRMSTTV